MAWGLRSRLLGFVATALCMVSLSVLSVVPHSAPAAAATGVTSRFEPVEPHRLLDTRRATPVAANSAVAVPLEGIDLTGITAVVVNLTAVQAAAPGFLTAFAAGSGRPEASNLNVSQSGQTVAALATVPVGADGQLAVFASMATDLLVDVFGVYRAANYATAGRFMALSPTRAVDTRDGAALGPQEERVVDLTSIIPASAGAVVVNLTATRTASAGYFTAWDATRLRPETSNLNVQTADDTVANQAVVPVTNGRIAIYSQAGGDVLVDVAGYFTGELAPAATDGLFVPVRPTRLLDTRTVELNPIENHYKPRAGNVLDVPIVGRAGVGLYASAVAVSVTGVLAESAGFLSVWPSGTPQPNASTANATTRGQTVANQALLPVTRWGISVTASTPWHLLVDITGWYTGKALPVTEAYREPVPGRIDGHLDLQALGLSWRLGDGMSDEELDPGPMRWTYSALPGELGTMLILGHRTSHGGPFLRIGQLRTGDRITATHNGKTFTYRVTYTEVVHPDNVVDLMQPDTANLILVACHPIGSTSQRIAVHAELAEG